MKLPFQKAVLPNAATVRAEFIAAVARLEPDRGPIEMADYWVKFARPDGTDEHRVSLGKIFERIGRSNATSVRARAATYDDFISALWSHKAHGAFDLDEFRSRIFPTPRRREFIQAVLQGVGGEATLLHRALGEELIISYVIDFPKTVTHVTSKQADELGLDEAGLWAIAIENAQRILPRAQFRALFASSKIVEDVPCADGLARPRLIAMIGYLEEGEEAGALMLDGGKLMLIQTPPANNWNSLRSAAKTNATSTGWNRPLLMRKSELVLM